MVITAEIPMTKKTDEKIIIKFFFSKKSKKAPKTVSVTSNTDTVI